MQGLSAALGRLEKFKEWFETLPDGEDQDPAPWDWYAQSCPCDLPPGECSIHPRARLAQRPPTDRDWRVFALVCGRGAGKTRSGVSWVIDRVQRGVARNVLLIASTFADVRDTVVEGPSGILACSLPEDRPR